MSTEKKLSSFATLNYARRTNNTPGVGYWYLFMKFAEGGKQPPMLVYSNTTITHYELLYKPNMLSQGMTQLCHTIIVSRCSLCKIISGLLKLCYEIRDITMFMVDRHRIQNKWETWLHLMLLKCVKFDPLKCLKDVFF